MIVNANLFLNDVDIQLILEFEPVFENIIQYVLKNLTEFFWDTLYVDILFYISYQDDKRITRVM